MTMQQAIVTCFAKYATFRGRASRAEYWYWILFTALVGLVLAVMEALAFGDAQAVSGLFQFVTLLPTLAVGARRLHDIDRTGWWQLLWAVPFFGWIVLIVWACGKGQDVPNRFGPVPGPGGS